MVAKPIHVALVLGPASLFFIYYTFSASATDFVADQDTVSEESRSLQATETITPDTIPISVSGVVVASETIDIRAQTNGVLSELFVSEGMTLTPGTPLFQQALPVVAAQEQVTAVHGERLQAEAALEREQSEYRTEQTQVDERTSAELAVLRSRSGSVAVESQEQALEVAMEKTLVTLVSVLDFINQERTYFSREEQQQYQAVVQNLYGNLPNYLVGSLRYPIEYPADLLDLLDADLSGDELAGVAIALDVQLSTLLKLLQSAESEFYDDDAPARESGVLDKYTEVRQSILEARSGLRKAESELWAQALGSESEVVAALRDAEVSRVDHERQQQLVQWQQTLEGLVADAVMADVAVTQAERSLGRGVAPWSGVVERVYAEVGEYVAAGEPILRMYSEEGREIEVTLPLKQAQDIAEGARLQYQDQVIGVVDRRTVESSSGRVVLFVTITDPSIELGSVVRGVFQVPMAEGQELISREQVRFGSHGPYRLVNGETYPVNILRDLGDHYLIQSQ